ncbi:hypothetical protein XELAEV_18042248mg [Xenopus laevis]|uniref:Uncharacterized protein n=1 Tax=Xenopus laevis TaxID=8355 RepID=A0A974C3T4_XENLA|nr:hypothetical protein XELAEV_18042248mg [Xenopus laevis]
MLRFVYCELPIHFLLFPFTSFVFNPFQPLYIFLFSVVPHRPFATVPTPRSLRVPYCTPIGLCMWVMTLVRPLYFLH